MKHRHDSILSPVLVLFLTACGSVESGPGDDGPDGGNGDHRSDGGGDDDPGADGDPGGGDGPTVLSVTPVDGAAGVRPGADIRIVFDRPMDADSVEAAWSSTLLPAGTVTFSWNQAGDTLTVDPDDPLPVAEGEGLDPEVVDPISIAYSISREAEDTDGNALETAFQADFTTVRRMTAVLGRYVALTGHQESDGGSPASGSDVFWAGDTNTNLGVRILVSFALPDLPAGAELVAATMSAEQVSATQGIFNVFGGGLEAVHVRFTQLVSAYGAGSLGSMGIFSSSTADGSRSVPVTGAVADDLEDGQTYTQFRLELPFATDSDELFDSVQFTRDSFELGITYFAD